MRQKIFKRLTLSVLTCLLFGYVALHFLNYLYPLDLSRTNKTSTIITDRHGAWLHVYLSEDDKYRLPTRHGDLPNDYLRLLINYEDRDFYEHNGIDFAAIIRAAGQNIRHQQVISGASTLTMQTARLLMPQPRNLRGKVVQTFRAWQLDRSLSKDEILDIYTTLAPVGGNREGLSAAAYYYLHKPVDKLSLGESAWLIALTQSPERLSKDHHAAVNARNKVLKRAHDNSIIDTMRYEQALAEPLAIRRTPFPRFAPHIADKAKQEKQPKTTLDKSLQTALSQLLQGQLVMQHAQANLAGGIIDNYTGQWRAYVGSADFFSKARQGQVDMLAAVRSPGSALKPFITLYAFDWLNYQPETTIDDTPMVASYQPSNYDGLYQGRMTLATALAHSRNVPAVRLLAQIKPDYFSEKLTEHGIELHWPNHAKPNLSLALGGVGVRGSNVLLAYQQLAICAYGETTSFAKQTACANVTHILQQAQDDQGRLFFGREPVAFKTGTSYGWRDRWIFAYTKDYSVVLWAGRADGQFAEQRASAEQLIPLLRQVISLLPNPPQTAPQLNVKITANHHLPPRLRHVASEQKATQLIATTTAEKTDPNRLKITAPLINSVIDYSDNLRLNLQIQGGKPPFIYLLNDTLLAQTPDSRLPVENVSAGSYQLVVIDAEGNTVESHFRLVQSNTTKAERTVQWQ